VASEPGATKTTAHEVSRSPIRLPVPAPGPSGSSSSRTRGCLPARYQDLRSYSDGSVAYVAPGSGSTKLKVLRVLACN
jgi:hypothetical protein